MTQHSFSRFKRPLLALALLAAGPLLSGCSTSEATGRTFFNGGMSAEQEQQVGREQHDKILEEFGGAYEENAYLIALTTRR